MTLKQACLLWPKWRRNMHSNIITWCKNHVVEELRARGNVLQKGLVSLLLILFQHVEKRRKWVNWQSSEALMLSCFYIVTEEWTQRFCSSGMREKAGKSGLNQREWPKGRLLCPKPNSAPILTFAGCLLKKSALPSHFPFSSLPDTDFVFWLPLAEDWGSPQFPSPAVWSWFPIIAATA